MAEIDKIIHYMKYYFCKIQLKKNLYIVGIIDMFCTYTKWKSVDNNKLAKVRGTNFLCPRSAPSTAADSTRWTRSTDVDLIVSGRTGWLSPARFQRHKFVYVKRRWPWGVGRPRSEGIGSSTHPSTYWTTS